MAESKLSVTKKYIVNEGMPNEAVYDELEDAFWVKNEAGEELEYHIAKWKGRYGVIDERGSIVVPFDHSASQKISYGADSHVMYVAMRQWALVLIFRATDWRICQTECCDELIVEENVDGVPYIFAVRNNSVTIYDMQMNTKPGWSYYYYNAENALDYMYSIVKPLTRYSYEHPLPEIVSANGDVYYINDELKLTNNEYDVLEIGTFDFPIHKDFKIMHTERYCTNDEEKRIAENAFIIEGEIGSTDLLTSPDGKFEGVKEPIRKTYLLVIIPEDAKSHNYRIKDYFVHDLRDYSQKVSSESDRIMQRARQYMYFR